MIQKRFFLIAGLLALGASPALASCNAVTGASDVRFKSVDDEERDPLVDAAGVSITAIDLYQGIKRPLMQNGTPAAGGVAVVAGRQGLLRVFVATDPLIYNNLPVTGRLYIGDAEDPIVSVKTFVPTVTPDDSVLESTLNFDVPGELFQVGMTYRVELKQDPGAADPTGVTKYPEKDQELIDVKSDGATLKIVLVPVQYAADGSNRLPDTTPEQIQAYHDAFQAFYPIPAVDIQIRPEPLVWNQPVYATGADPNLSDWINLRDAVGDLRVPDNAPEDVYYFGIFNPSSSFESFCGGGCVAGIANIAGVGDSYQRYGIGLGYGGDVSNETAIHEVGHTFGREHSPCGGAGGPDPQYPYPAGNTGVWGYNLITKTLFGPESADVMSYCSPYWLSDYTYMKLFDRFVAVNKPMLAHFPEGGVTYARLRIWGDGQLQARPSITLRRPPVGHSTRDVTVLTETGPEIITGQYYPNDHAEGGELLWPMPKSRTAVIKVEYKGIIRSLAVN